MPGSDSVSLESVLRPKTKTNIRYINKSINITTASDQRLLFSHFENRSIDHCEALIFNQRCINSTIKLIMENVTFRCKSDKYRQSIKSGMQNVCAFDIILNGFLSVLHFLLQLIHLNTTQDVYIGYACVGETHIYMIFFLYDKKPQKFL